MLSIKSNIDQFQKDLDNVAKTQIPYATALAINALAKLVILGEIEEIEKDFPTATPFTKKGFGYIPATKNNPFATIYVKDIQERYLDPYVDGSPSVPTPGGAMVVPIKVPTNQYGNIPYKKLATLLGRTNVFYANKNDPRFHKGAQFSGVFQRYSRGTGPRGGKLTGLIVLAKMEDPWRVKQRFYFEQRAIDTVERNVQDALEQALLKALGSMR